MQKRKQNQQKTHKMMRKPIKFCIFVIFLAKNTEKRIQQQRNTYKIQRKPSNSASFVCFLVKKHVKRRQIQQNTRQNAEKTKKVQSVANKHEHSHSTSSYHVHIYIYMGTSILIAHTWFFGVKNLEQIGND